MTRTGTSRFESVLDVDVVPAASTALLEASVWVVGGATTDLEKRAASRLLVFVREAAATAAAGALAVRGRDRFDADDARAMRGQFDDEDSEGSEEA